MMERKGAVTFKGNPLTLVGDELKAGNRMPTVELLNNEINPVSLDHFRGKLLIVLTLPSLDTPVCDTETRKFNDYATTLSPDVEVLAISMDLPFAQSRWCGAAGVKRVQTLSDYRNASLGTAFGVLIKELRLLARAVYVIDREGVVRYVQLVKEITDEPNYDEVKRVVVELA